MSTRPNLLFIMPDQLRADFLGCYGADFVATPHIDALASPGVRYERSYSPSPVCVAARCALLTGRNAIKNGVLGNSHFLRPDLETCGIRTWPQILSGAGYLTAAIGKMHFYPWDAALGFEHRVICEDKRWLNIQDDYFHHLAAKGLHKLHGREHDGYQENRGAIISPYAIEDSWDGFVGGAAVDFIENYNDDRPFAAMIGFPGPHCPYDPCGETLSQIDTDRLPAAAPYVDDLDRQLRKANIRGNSGDWNGVDYTEFDEGHKHKIRHHYAALVKQIDDQVGRIMAALEATGQLDNTVIIFSSDHGDMLGDHGLIGKTNFYEGSCRVPMIVRQPAGATGMVNDDVVSLADVTASLLGLAGVERPAAYDSQTLPGLGLPDPPRDRVFGFVAGGMMNTDGHWKWMKNAGTGESHLFNIDDDPQEQIDRQYDGPETRQIADRLDAELTQTVMRSIDAASSDRRVGPQAMWDNDRFGRGDWTFDYPSRLED
ncbi:MAG: sulfatase-like hydrolase/transferase [Gemmatimonadetes bacterium]|nr:sulfatase-like hydrolase/transferase [Gemmatimonadota bacterium]MBT7864233.1 sulfatase-like hydrolase/transferase [Gemmatimonadota bacterium]